MIIKFTNILLIVFIYFHDLFVDIYDLADNNNEVYFNYN